MNAPFSILIVDDNQANRETLFALLEGQAYQLFEATDGHAALRLAADLLPDLVLLDVMMPDIDGLEVCRRLRADEKLAEIPILLLTALSDQASRLAGLEAGADDFISKPFDRIELRTRIRTIARLKRYRRLVKTQERLRTSEERFQMLAEQSDELFWFHRVSPFRVDYLSPAVEPILGRSADQFYENPLLWVKTIHPEDRSRVWASYEAVAGGRVSHFEEEYRVVIPSGEIRWVHDTGNPMRNDRQIIVGMGGVARDVTERKNAAEHLLRAQRIESIGMLASGIAHDFNNALAPIVMAGPLLQSYITDPRGLRMVETIERSAKRGVDLVKQLMTFTRGGGDKKCVLEIAAVLREVLELAKATFPRSINVTSDLADDLRSVVGNPTQIHQIILNLCVNARDATPLGGELKVTASNCVIDERAAAEMPDGRAGAFVRIDVSDTGTGIPPEVLARIWQPFFTTKNVGKGTGLGLSTVRGLVEAHCGFVSVKTAPDQGTCFTIYIPVATEATHDLMTA